MSFTLLPGYYREEKPWGSFERLAENQVCTVKILHVDANKRFSLQRHKLRAEFWRVIEGSGIFHVDGTDTEVKIGDEVHIPVGSIHRITGGPSGIRVLEVTTGTHDESDIERLEDDFGRT
jgi:mannose-6-phosphate isomerase-like protein (cupin superfamily)